MAGHMTGTKGFSFKIFDAVADELRNRGIDVLVPSELEDPKTRRIAMASVDGDAGKYFAETGLSRGRLLGRDVRLVLDDTDCVVVIPGWKKSRGALLETYAAHLHGKPVLYYPTLRKVPLTALRAAWSGQYL